MNSNDKPGFQLPPESFDDVEGHAIRGHGLVEDAQDDVEGHGKRLPPIDGPDAENVEGHMPRIRLAGEPPEDPEGQADDTEGHGLRGNLEAPESDDVEGHTASYGRIVEGDEPLGEAPRR